MKYDRRIDSRREACYRQATRNGRTATHETIMNPLGDAHATAWNSHS